MLNLINISVHYSAVTFQLDDSNDIPGDNFNLHTYINLLGGFAPWPLRGPTPLAAFAYAQAALTRPFGARSTLLL